MCTIAESCDECINTNYRCGWCYKRDFHKIHTHRCNLFRDLYAAGCYQIYSQVDQPPETEVGQLGYLNCMSPDSLGQHLDLVHLISLSRQKPCSYMSRVKQICVFEHSVMTNFNCACPTIQRGQGSGFLSESSS